MSRLNLLPWREQRRHERDKKMLSLAVFIWILCGAAVFGGYFWVGVSADGQRERNRYLQNEIAELDKKITTIKDLSARRKDIIARMAVIQNLQRERTQVVQLFDDLAKQLPEGMYYQSLGKQGVNINLVGVAESNTRVSELLGKLGQSPRLTDARIETISVKQSPSGPLSEFKLRVNEVHIGGADAEADKKKK